MKKWAQIEEILNQLLQHFGQVIARFLQSLLPRETRQSFSIKKKKVEKNQNSFKNTIQKISQDILEKISIAANIIQKWLGKIKKIIGSAASQLQKDPFSIPQKIFLNTVTIFKKIKSFYRSLETSTIISFTSLLTVGALSALHIYQQSQKIRQKRELAESVKTVKKVETLNRRPTYFRKPEKQFGVTNIVLPTYLEKGKGLRKLVIDFTFESSNKYIKAYFWENPHLIQDVLNSKIEPITIGFPLEAEGKIIIKEKIILEMNMLLKKLRIKGKITNVYIDRIIGG